MTLILTPTGRMRLHRMERLNPYAFSSQRDGSEIYFPVDIKAEPDAFVISALLPGLTADDVSIQIMNETVTIQGELKVDRDEDGEYLLAERPAGRFSRVFTLPATPDPNRAEASLENGVLTLRIPKTEEARPKTIKVTH